MRSLFFRFLVLAFWLCAFVGAWQARCDRTVRRCDDIVRQAQAADAPETGGKAGARRHAVPAYAQSVAAADAACQALVPPPVPVMGPCVAVADPVAAHARLWRWSLPPPMTPVQSRCRMLI